MARLQQLPWTYFLLCCAGVFCNNADCASDSFGTCQDATGLLQSKVGVESVLKTMEDASETSKHSAQPQAQPRSSGSFIHSSLWAKAVKQLLPIKPSLPGVNETIWASGEKPQCGKDCVAHCVAGQPRDFAVPGLRKALKYRLFKKFSQSYVVFAVFATSPYTSDDKHYDKDGRIGFARTQMPEFSDTHELVSGMEDIGVHRALLLQEACQHPSCMENPKLQCDAREFGALHGYDKKDGKVHNICDVQLRRFQTCMNMVVSYEQEQHVTFQWVARSRPDVYWLKPAAPVTMLNPAAQVQQIAYFRQWGGAYGGIDWFYAVPRKYADVLARFPDEASCSLLHHPDIRKNCQIIGCECWLVSWMLQQNVSFQAFTGITDAFIPAKFCGETCPQDWEVNDASIENWGVSLLKLQP